MYGKNVSGIFFDNCSQHPEPEQFQQLYDQIKRDAGAEFAVFACTGVPFSNAAAVLKGKPYADYFCCANNASPAYQELESYKELVMSVPLASRPGYGVIHHSLDINFLEDNFEQAQRCGCSFISFSNFGEGGNHAFQLPDNKFLSSLLTVAEAHNRNVRPRLEAIRKLPVPASQPFVRP